MSANTLTSDGLLDRVIGRLSEEAGLPAPRNALTYKESLRGTLSAMRSGGADIGRTALTYMMQTLARKSVSLNIGVDKVAAAVAAWEAAEIQCLSTNRRLNRDFLNPNTPQRGYGAHLFLRIISDAQVLIQKVIGPAPRRAELIRSARWSSGATLRTPRGAGADAKMSFPLVVSRRAFPLLKAAVEADLHWLRALIPECEGPTSLLPTEENFCFEDVERLITVPKDAWIDRMISAGPAGNAYLQQGVGRFLRRRLKRFGIDLDDQSNNQRGAETALLKGWATLDLSSASDTLSQSLIDLLLPVEWKILLDDLRSHYAITLNGERRKLNKFSAMGNAFTFELETLVFWALAYATIGSNRDLLVYGDDIIVPTEWYQQVVATLEYCGFSINLEKSYSAPSRFYESCGAHFYEGCDVTPVYQKSDLKSLLQVTRFHNRLAAWKERCHHILSGSQRGAVEDCMAFCLEEALSTYGFLPRVPYGSEYDGGFWCDDPHGFSYTKRLKAVAERLVFRPTKGRFSPVESFHLALKLRHEPYVAAPKGWLQRLRLTPSMLNSGPGGHVVLYGHGKFVRHEQSYDFRELLRTSRFVVPKGPEED